MPEQRFDSIDAGQAIDWGKTSADYDRYRPGPPESFYHKLAALDVGLAQQSILDLGTGTGLLARRFAQNGCQVCGIDQSIDQIDMAQAAAAREALSVEFSVANAEALPYEDNHFDVITANQCWIYFDLRKVLPEVLRTLKPNGRLVVSHFSFMPHLDPVVQASEALVLKYNSEWSGANWDGQIKPEPTWAKDLFELSGWFVYDELIPFTHESWRGRMRALRGLAASLSEETVAQFDAEHRALLTELTDDPFDVWHRIHAQILTPIK